MARKITTNISTVRRRRKVFVDTEGWYSLSWDEDSHHEACTRYYQQLVHEGVELLTSDYVLDETITRLRYDFSHVAAMAFWEQVEQAQRQGSLSIMQVNSRVWAAAINIFRRYEDQDFSFTDCTSFVFAEEEGVDEVFTLDRHFLTMGFVIRPV